MGVVGGCEWNAYECLRKMHEVTLIETGSGVSGPPSQILHVYSTPARRAPRAPATRPLLDASAIAVANGCSGGCAKLNSAAAADAAARLQILHGPPNAPELDKKYT